MTKTKCNIWISLHFFLCSNRDMVSCVQTETWFPVFKQRHGFLYSNRDMVSCVQTEIWFPVFKQRYGFQIFFFRKKSSYLKLFLIPLKTLIKSELFQFFLGNNHKLDIVRFEKFFKIFCIIRNSILMRHTLQC